MRRLGVSFCTQDKDKPPRPALIDSEKSNKKGAEPVTVQGFEGWALEGLDNHPRTNGVRDDYERARTWPRPKQAIAWDALSRVRDRQGGL